MYRHLMGWHAPRIRRVMVMLAVTLVVFLATWAPLGWELAALVGWDAGAALFLGVTWELIVHADAAATQRVATIEDETGRSAALLILTSSNASLLAVIFTLAAADEQTGFARTAYIVGALVTVVLSWTVVNTLYTLRYADAHYRHGGHAVEFGGRSTDLDPPDYRDFAYLAFTIGMCYQVSDQTIGCRHMRRTVLVHSLVSYVFGVFIIAATINAIAGLLTPA
jgi:uncharacterized membrane protein